MEYASLGFRYFIAAVFVFAGLSKFPRLAEFESAVGRYRLLPERFVRDVARALPPFELVCGLLLLMGLGIRIVSALLAVTLITFAGAVSINLLRGRAIDCGCFTTTAPQRITWLTVARNVALAAAAITVALTAPRALSLDGAIAGAQTQVGRADATAIAIVSVSLLAATTLSSAALAFRAASISLRRL